MKGAVVASDASWKAYKCRGKNSAAHCIYGSHKSFHLEDLFPIYGSN